MKKTVLFTFILAAATSFAQTDLTLFGGYQFGAKNYSYNGTLKLKSNADYGAMLEFGIRPDLMIQLQWTGSDTWASLTGPYGALIAKENVAVNYYQIGAIRPFPINDKVEAFGDFSMGATQFNIKNDAYQDEWRFSVTLGLGTKIWLSDVVGIRLQARLLAPINWAGLGFFCGTGGCGSSVNAGSTFISGDVGAGLVFRLKQ